MSRLKELIHEIHRRSLWQVLLIYVGGAWICYEIIDTITDRLALPDWLPVLAIILFLLGLPVVLATAFVGEVEAPSRAPAEAELAAAQLVTRRRHRFLTWRNAAATFVIVLAAWGVVATGWLLFGRTDEESATADERPAVAVLPLENRSGLPDDQYFTDGIHDEILTQLTKISGLSVRARTSVLEYRDSPKNVRQIGEELNARYLMEGGVQRAGGTVRIIVQLVDTETDEHVFAETYDRELSLENLLAIQTEVARRIAEELEAALTPDEEERLAAVPTANPEAYDHYLRGRHFWQQRSLVAFDSAIDYYNRAILLDPEYARAYTGLAETYVLLPEFGGPAIPEILPLAKAATERALSLDPDLAEAYAASGYLKAVFEWDRAAAEQDLLKAIEHNPDCATAHYWYAEVLGVTRRWDEALEEARRALELDPLSVAAHAYVGMLLMVSGRSDEAIPVFERALEIAPDWDNAVYQLATAHVLRGDYTAAAPLYDRLAELTGTDPETYRAFLAALSDPAKTRAAVTALQTSKVYGDVGSSDYLAQLGRLDEALVALEQAYEARRPYLPWVNTHVWYEQLRSDPRFQDLLRRMNFPD